MKNSLNFTQNPWKIDQNPVDLIENGLNSMKIDIARLILTLKSESSPKLVGVRLGIIDDSI